MKKTLTIILMVALLIGTVQAANRFGDTYHEVQIEDETGRIVDDITNLYIYLAGTTTDATIYMDKNRQNTITIPMTEASDNTTLIDGVVYWWGPDAYDFSMTNGDGAGPMTNSGHADRNSAGGTLVFPSYLQSISSTSYLDAQTITMGTGGVWVINGTSVGTLLSFTPASDNSTVNFGTSGTTLNTSFNVYVGTLLGLKLDASVPSLTWDGGAANINVGDGGGITNINTGASTSAVNIGSGTSGVWTVDGTSSGSLSCDAQMDINTTDGLADIVIDAQGGRLLLLGGENAANAILATVDGGTTATIRLWNDTGTAADSVNILTDVGGITATASAGSITLTATGAETGDMVFTAGDNYALTADDNLSATSTTGTLALAASAGTITITAVGAETGDITVIAGDNYALTADDNLSATATTGTLALTASAGTLALTSSAGSVTITATGAQTGDMTFTVGDNYVMTANDNATLTASTGTLALVSSAGSMTFTSTGVQTGDMTFTVGDNLAIGVTGNTTITTAGTLSVAGSQLTNVLREIEIESGTSETVLAADSGKVFQTIPGAGTTTYTLPTAAAGLTFSFLRSSAAAGDDVIVTANSGDTINSGAAAASYQNITDAVPGSVTLIAVDAGSWEVTSQAGTWSNV